MTSAQLTAARSAGQEMELRHSLGGIQVRDVMVVEPVTIPDDTPVEIAVAEYFLRRGLGGFPVTSDGEIRGMIQAEDLDRVPGPERRGTRVRDVMCPLESLPVVGPAEPVRNAVERMVRSGRDRLLVVEHVQPHGAQGCGRRCEQDQVAGVHAAGQRRVLVDQPLGLGLDLASRGGEQVLDPFRNTL